MDMYDKIEALLKERKMNKTQLAGKIGVPYTTLMSAFSRKSKRISYNMLYKIAYVLGVPAKELMDGYEKEHQLIRAFALDDYLRRFGYHINGDPSEGHLWIEYDGYSYEIYDWQLFEIEKSVSDFARFKMNDLLRESEKRPIKNKDGE